MKILLVGAGAVGQVYGYHLHLGGAEIGFFIKEKYRAACEKGLLMYPRNGKRKESLFQDYVLRSHIEEISDEHWDQIWICVSSTAIYKGNWLEQLAKAAPSSTFVSFQPGLQDREHFLRFLPSERIISALIGFISWQAPLPGEILPKKPGMMYWFPPVSPSLFEGQHVDPILSLLKKGKQPAKKTTGVCTKTATASSILLTFIAALELASWSLQELGKSSFLSLACQSAKEALQISSAYHQKTPSRLSWICRPFLFRIALSIARWICPFNLEAYLQYHFSKVRDQTLASLQSWIQQGNSRSLPIDTLSHLQKQLSSIQST